MKTTISPQLVHHGEQRDRIGRVHVPAARRRELLALFRESGLTRQAFARREGVRYTTFCTWVQRAPKTATPALRFAEVSLPPLAAPAPSPSFTAALLEVRFPDGTTLRGERADALATLARALRV
jgi:hypothetical protein